jgi:hypothetical protein
MALIRNRAFVVSGTGTLVIFGALGHFTQLKNGFESRHPEFEEAVHSLTLSHLSLQYDHRVLQHCELDQDGRKTATFCMSDANRPSRFAVVGDSHAQALYPGLISLKNLNGWTLMSRTACPPIQDVLVDTDEECVRFNKKLLETLIASSTIEKVLLVTSLRMVSPPHTFRKPGATDPSNEPRDLLYEGFSKTIKNLQAAGKQVSILIDIPAVTKTPELCLERPFKVKALQSDDGCSIPVSEYHRRADDFYILVSRLKSSFPGLLVYDPTNLFCGSGTCITKIKNRSLYSDTDHLSIFGSELVANGIAKELHF